MRNLLDPEDGENRAVRAFLMHYGAPGLTVKQMRDNMRRAGWECWPAWVGDADGHLTKGGAQNWLRYLFALENTAGSHVPRAADALPMLRTMVKAWDAYWMGGRQEADAVHFVSVVHQAHAIATQARMPAIPQPVTVEKWPELPDQPAGVGVSRG